MTGDDAGSAVDLTDLAGTHAAKGGMGTIFFTPAVTDAARGGEPDVVEPASEVGSEETYG